MTITQSWMGSTGDGGQTIRAAGSATTDTVSIAGATDGDICFMLVALSVGETGITTPTGWNLIAEGGEGANGAAGSRTGLFWRQKQTGDTTFTVTWSSTATKYVIQAFSYSGLNTSTPVEGGAYSAHSATSANYVSPSVTPTSTDRWILTGSHARSTTQASTFTPDAALTERQDVTNGANSWSSIELADSNAAVTQAAHTYTAVASFADGHGGTVAVALIPAPQAQASFVPQPQRRTRALTPPRRVKAPVPVPEQQTTTRGPLVARPHPIAPRTRSHIATPVPPQVITPPPYVPPPPHRPRQILGRARGRAATPPPGQTHPPLVVKPDRPRVAASRARGRNPVPVAQEAPVWGLARRAIRNLLSRKPHQPSTPLAVVVVPPPTLVPQGTRKRARNGWRWPFRRRRNEVPPSGAAPAPGRDIQVAVGPLVAKWQITGPVESPWNVTEQRSAWQVRWLMLTQSVLSTEYVRAKVETTVNGQVYDPTGDTVKMAFLTSGNPGPSDWVAASWEDSSVVGVFWARCNVGPAGTTALAVGTYNAWLQITDNPEIPVRLFAQLRIT